MGHQAGFIVHTHDRRRSTGLAGTVAGARGSSARRTTGSGPGISAAIAGATASSTSVRRTAAATTPLATRACRTALRGVNRRRCALGSGIWRAARRAAAGRAPDQRLQVDFFHHSAGDQELIGRLVGRVHALGQHGSEGILDQQPALTGHLHIQPLVYQNARDHIGQQHVATWQLLALFQVLDAQPQFIEIGGHQLEDAHRQARGQDLVVNGALGQQLQSPGHAQQTGIGCARGTGQQGSLKGLATLVQPVALAFLERHPGVPPFLHFAGRAGLVEDRRQPGFAGFDEFGHDTAHMNHEEFTRLFGQGRNVLIGSRHRESV
jgi:hypothetical protein